MKIECFDKTLTVEQYNYEGLCIQLESTFSDYEVLSIELNKEQLRGLYQYLHDIVAGDL